MKRTPQELELCKENVARNICHVALGEELDMPLKVLNQSCKFRNAWDKFAGKDKEVKAKKREYQQKPEVKAKKREYQREYQQKPEVKAKQREYQQKPEVKAKKREYYQKPEVKAKQREYYQKNKKIILKKLHKFRKLKQKSEVKNGCR